MIDICPYYFRDGISNEFRIYFEYCHKPKDVKLCPSGRKSNECKVHRIEMELTEEGRKWILGK